MLVVAGGEDVSGRRQLFRSVADRGVWCRVDGAAVLIYDIIGVS